MAFCWTNSCCCVWKREGGEVFKSLKESSRFFATERERKEGKERKRRGFGKAAPIALIQEKRIIAVRFVKAEAGHRNLRVQSEFASVCENLIV